MERLPPTNIPAIIFSCMTLYGLSLFAKFLDLYCLRLPFHLFNMWSLYHS